MFCAFLYHLCKQAYILSFLLYRATRAAVSSSHWHFCTMKNFWSIRSSIVISIMTEWLKVLINYRPAKKATGDNFKTLWCKSKPWKLFRHLYNFTIFAAKCLNSSDSLELWLGVGFAPLCLHTASWSELMKETDFKSCRNVFLSQRAHLINSCSEKIETKDL